MQHKRQLHRRMRLHPQQQFQRLAGGAEQPHVRESVRQGAFVKWQRRAHGQHAAWTVGGGVEHINAQYPWLLQYQQGVAVAVNRGQFHP